MSRALSDRCPGKRRLPMVQVALMLEFLLHIPLRISDLTKLRFGENISWPAGPKGPACLALTIEKTGEPFQAELDGELAAMLKGYREKLVPKLTGRRHDELFVSVDGRRKLPATLSVEFKGAMIEHLGFAITPPSVAAHRGEADPRSQPGCLRAHSPIAGPYESQKYAISNYAGVDTNRAVRHHDQLIQEMRAQRQLPRTNKSKPQPKEQEVGKCSSTCLSGIGQSRIGSCSRQHSVPPLTHSTRRLVQVHICGHAARKPSGYGYARWLAWLVREMPESLAHPPAERVTRERIKAYAGALGQTMRPSSVASYIAWLSFACSCSQRQKMGLAEREKSAA